MAYTNTWNNNTPTNNDPANMIDEYIRQLKLDIHERMNSLVEDWTADPVKFPQVDNAIAFAKRYKVDGGVVSENLDVKAVLKIDFIGTTSTGGLIQIDLDEFSEGYSIADLCFRAKIPGILYDTSNNNTYFPIFTTADSNTKVITYTVRKHDGSVVSNRVVRGELILYFNSIT